jgi:hypothetical protein
MVQDVFNESHEQIMQAEVVFGNVISFNFTTTSKNRSCVYCGRYRRRNLEARGFDRRDCLLYIILVDLYIKLL